jgi:hypothetical protein
VDGDEQIESLASGIFYIHNSLKLFRSGQMRALLVGNGLAVTNDLDESTNIIVGDVETAPAFGTKITARVVDEEWIVDEVQKCKLWRRKKRQKGKQYGVAFETDEMQALLSGEEFPHRVQYDVGAASKELDSELYVSNDFREWDFSAAILGRC